MTYINLILAILITRFAPGLCGTWGDVAFRRWHNFLRPGGDNDGGDDLRFYALIALPVVALAIGLALLHSGGWRFAAHAVSFVVLLCCFGVTDLRARIDAYVTALNRNDLQGAYRGAMTFGSEQAENWDQLHQRTLRAIAWAYFQCYFPVIFWFALLGAPGALLYRLLCLYRHRARHELDGVRLDRLLAILEWLPLRLFGLSLALVGNWQATMEPLLRSLKILTEPPAETLAKFITASLQGVAATREDTPASEVAELEALPALVDRALISWIAVLGVVAVA